MNRLKPTMILLLGLVIVVGCSRSDDAPPSIGGDVSNSVDVGFTAGMAVTQTRTAFENDLPVVLYVYQRRDLTKMDLKMAPHKVIKGKTSAGASGLSKILFNESADGITYKETFQLRRSRTYDFVLIVGSDELGYNNGSVYGVPHGLDILTGRKEDVDIAASGSSTSKTLDIKFTEYGADVAGNLPHISSGTAVRVGVTQELLDFLGGSVELGVSRAVFKKLPASGVFDFASSPLALNLVTGGYVSNYNMIANTLPETVTNTTSIVSYEKGVILPYPQRDPVYENMIDIDFYIDVNGGEVMLAAENVEVPVFEPGLRYAFRLTMDNEEIVLYLSVELWDGVSWDSGMGGEESTYLNVKVGGWSNVYWESGMGGDGSDKVLIRVNGWSSATWDGDMGGTNPDGTNDPV